MKWNPAPNSTKLVRRSPHGERGLKYCLFATLTFTRASLSSRRAWIEIEFGGVAVSLLSRRSPHGERGLKYQLFFVLLFCHKSLSSRRAWIEIVDATSDVEIVDCRSPHGERGLKCQEYPQQTNQ